MREQFGGERPASRRSEYTAHDLEADWSYLRANLDHPARRLGNRLGSGLAEWLLRRIDASSAPAPHLSVLARIALSPRQSVALVEAEGVHLLVGTSADGPPCFFPLGASAGYGPGPHADRSGGRGWQPNLIFPDDAAAAEPVRSRRAAPGLGTWGAHAGGRPTNRPRLIGRVSWV